MLLLKKSSILLFSTLLYGFGLYLTFTGNIGLSPWDVFHQGISLHIPLSMGHVSILVGFILVLVNWFAKECVGLGTLFNMFFVGFSFDIYVRLHLLAPSASLLPSILFVLAGLAVIAAATYFYLSPQMGAGPRDGLMTVFTKKSKWPVGVCRAIIEGSVLFFGFLLGGQVGLGTLITVILIGPSIQLSFKVFGFDARKVRHESLAETFRKSRGRGETPGQAGVSDGQKCPEADPDIPVL